MSAPSVAIFGPHGFVGREILPAFLEALQSKEISSLKLMTQNPNLAANDAPKKQGAEILRHCFEDKSQLCSQLEGVDVVVSCIGTGGDYKENRKILVEACANANVKVYVPSEWGTDHRNIKYQHPMFLSKQEHHAYSEKLGIKTVAIYTGLIMETSFCKWFGFDTKNRMWNVVGTGERPVAMTSQRDLGPLTLRTILLAFSSPDDCPSHLRVYSDNQSIKDYREFFQRISGESLGVNFVSLRNAERDYELGKSFIPSNMLGPLMNLLVADGSFDHSANGRDIINPDQRHFKWKTVEDYATEVSGLPWENSSPW